MCPSILCWYCPDCPSSMLFNTRCPNLFRHGWIVIMRRAICLHFLRSIILALVFHTNCLPDIIIPFSQWHTNFFPHILSFSLLVQHQPRAQSMQVTQAISSFLVIARDHLCPHHWLARLVSHLRSGKLSRFFRTSHCHFLWRQPDLFAHSCLYAAVFCVHATVV